MDEKEFFRLYQEIKFKEDSSDCFSVAATKRKTLALNFYGSTYFKESNSVTEFLLYEDMMDYGEIVDKIGPGNVNNYADGVLLLLSNHQNDDRKNWESHLDEIDLKDFLEPLPCSNNINCINSEESYEEIIAELKPVFEANEEVEPVKRFKDTKPTFPSTVSQIYQSKSNELDKCNFLLNNQKVIEQRNEEVTVEEPSHSEERKANCLNAFRTARDELHIQNAKKFNKGEPSGSIKSYGLGTNKKSLGTRKGGVFGKFQPPIKNKDAKDEKHSPVISMEVDEPVDERLKNIDPAMIELIKNEIMNIGPKITWSDIAGLHLAKTTIQEIVVWPMLRPDIFTGLRRPPKGILLFGPPGTGKTLIGKCIASQSNSTFFSISASSLTSKWVGDGEKMVRTLFAVAKVYQPSVVFIDEIDSLLSQRSDSEHECSRRIKTEFLVQLDGAGTGDEDRILIIGATNRPQELDEAARRRLVKRLYIPLPDKEARKQIIENLISSESHCLTDAEVENIAQLTEGYSGADVKNLCQEASLGPIRSITPSMIQCINPADVRPVNSKDFETALSRIKSSVSEKDLEVYVKWDKQYGCGSAFS